jgi:hypothetical protein
MKRGLNMSDINTGLHMLSRESILNCVDFTTEVVEVPEWGGALTVKSLSGAERDRFEASITTMNNGVSAFKFENMRAKLVALSVIDPETKELMFTSGDIDALGKKSAAALQRVFNVAQRLSGLSPKDVESLTKN